MQLISLTTALSLQPRVLLSGVRWVLLRATQRIYHLNGPLLPSLWHLLSHLLTRGTPILLTPDCSDETLSKAGRHWGGTVGSLFSSISPTAAAIDVLPFWIRPSTLAYSTFSFLT